MSTVLSRAILAAADAVEAAREPLCALDAAAGDGDHGITMTIGARGVRDAVARTDPEDPVALVRAAALGMSGVGGAIGPIWTAGLLAAAGALDAARGPDGRVEASTATARVAAAAAGAAVAQLGGAREGDKTILDALLPAIDALAAAGDEASLARSAAAAAAAAEAGAEGTAAMIATVGRAARLGERSRGTADPGATSLAIVIRALADATPEEDGT